jgi:peptide/nickel transport system substrate-binding protein
MAMKVAPNLKTPGAKYEMQSLDTELRTAEDAMNRVLVGLLSMVLCLGPAAEAQQLKIGLASEPTSIDPQFYATGVNEEVSRHFFDPLVLTDEHQRLLPGLAESWRTVDPTTWEFQLRRGVMFHDGSEFTAEDVVATIRRAPRINDSPGSFATYVRPIKDIEIVDPHTIRFHTAQPYPLLANDLSALYIISHRFAQASTEDFTSGRAMVGTGPFVFGSWQPGENLVMRRNDRYWGPKPPWAEVILRPITNDSARMAALLSGTVDFIESVPTASLGLLRSRDDYVLAQAVTTRFIYLQIDVARDRSPFVADDAGQPLDRNPLKDHRVRLALSKAINRAAIVEHIMDGTAAPAGQLFPEGYYGVSPRLQPEPFDPEGARRLLAEAGYPDGFKITIHGPSDRFVNGGRILLSIGQMLARVGIDATIEALPSNVFFPRAAKSEFSLFLVSWMSDTGDPSSPLRGIFATRDASRGWGPSNRGGYSSPAMDALLAEASTTLDDERREELLQKATEIAIGDVAIIPIEFQLSVWGMRRGLAYQPRSDGYTVAQSVTSIP